MWMPYDNGKGKKPLWHYNSESNLIKWCVLLTFLKQETESTLSSSIFNINGIQIWDFQAQGVCLLFIVEP